MSVYGKMGVEGEIRKRLEAAFTPRALVVGNESHLHKGHAGDDGSGESHFRVTIRAATFAPMSRIERHRAVHAALGADLVGRIHALTLVVEG